MRKTMFVTLAVSALFLAFIACKSDEVVTNPGSLNTLSPGEI